jgi:hypothetical protein
MRRHRSRSGARDNCARRRTATTGQTDEDAERTELLQAPISTCDPQPTLQILNWCYRRELVIRGNESHRSTSRTPAMNVAG